ncbi:hypothetical protein Tco_0775952 [Tanacetum coccineum]
MAVLESCPKHNMVAYLEKSEGNAEFHEVIDFLARSSIYHALTVSPVVSTTFVEQFWMSAKSKIINNVRYITAKVAGKPVSISEASIRSDLLFDDADGIDSLPNQAIFDAIQLMGYEGDLTVLTFNKALFSPQWRHLDAKKKFVMYPRFISIFLNKQLVNVPVPLDHFPVNALTSKVFSFMVKKERPSEPQPTPFPPHSSEANVEPQSEPSPRPSPSTHIPDSIPENSGGNHGGYRSSQGNKRLKGTDQEASKESQTCYYTPQNLDEECSLEAKIGRKEILEEKLDAKGVLNEEKETADDKVSTEDALSTAQQKVNTDKQKVSTDRPNVSTDRPKVNTDKEKDSTVSPDEGTEGRSATPTTPTTTPTMFEDDETIAQVLLNMSIPKAEKKFKQLARDEEMARKVQEDWEAEEEVKKLAEEEAIKTALSNEYDFIQARIEADRLLALRLQDEEREKFTVEERAKFLHDTIAGQRRFLAEQRAIVIRNKPPTRTQLRNQMMTYLKHVGNKKHSDLKNKTFEEIQALYEKVKRFDESFTVVGSTEDERRIKEMNEGVKDPDQKSLKKRVVEETLKTEDTAKHRKCLKIVTFEGTMDSEIMERKSVIARLNKVISPDGDYLVIYRVLALIY